MSDGTVFGLQPGHLGRHRSRDDIHLHGRVSATLERIRGEFPGCLIDVLDGDGDRIRDPAEAGAFVLPVEAFDIPRSAPQWLVVDNANAAARLAAAFPDMAGRPWDGPGEAVAFELDRAHLGRDGFGLVRLNDAVRQAIDAVPGETRWKLLDGEGLPVKPARTGASEKAACFDNETVSVLNGYEPRYLVLHDRAAAEKFAALFPAMRRERLAGLERIWRAARKG